MDTKEMQEEWNTGIITPIHKKGNKKQCENYRAITLLNTTYKILANLINKRLKLQAEEILGDYQNGFRPGRSTINGIHILEQIFQKTRNYNKEVHVLFVDFKSAFDSINREKMMKELKTLNISQTLSKLFKMTIHETKAKVRF